MGLVLCSRTKRLMAAWITTMDRRRRARAAVRQLREEAFDSVEPRAGCRHEVEGPARMTVEPFAHLRVLVRSVVVEDCVDLLSDRDRGLDSVEVVNELLVAVPLNVPDGAVDHVQRGEDWCHAACSRGSACRQPFFIGRPGCVPVEGLDRTRAPAVRDRARPRRAPSRRTADRSRA
jgi:hypothetical protein